MVEGVGGGSEDRRWESRAPSNDRGRRRTSCRADGRDKTWPRAQKMMEKLLLD